MSSASSSQPTTQAAPEPEATKCDSGSKSCSDVVTRTVQKQNHYKNVHVLLTCWKDEVEGFWGETTKLRDVFENLYHFQTEIYRIPSQKPECRLIAKIKEVQEKAAQDNSLFIMDYSGHGGLGEDEEGDLNFSWSLLGTQDSFTNGQPCSSTTQHRKWMSNPSVQWGAVEKALRATKKDVLVLIDSCDSSAAMSRPSSQESSGRFDLIAACGFHGSARCPVRQVFDNQYGACFTDILIFELIAKANAGEAFTTANLHLSIMRRMIDVNKKVHIQFPTPVYFSMGAVEGTPSPSITLTALEEKVEANLNGKEDGREEHTGKNKRTDKPDKGKEKEVEDLAVQQGTDRKSAAEKPSHSVEGNECSKIAKPGA